MPSPLVPITIASIYRTNGARKNLPPQLACCTPDTRRAILALAAEVLARGGALYLSDLFRSHAQQQQAHDDYVRGRKRAYSPPPGGSMHEAGRAFDLDLAALKIPLLDFWALAAAQGVVPIIAEPDASASEAWHFECRGSHQRVYDYYRAGKGTNFPRPATAMAASAIAVAGLDVDCFQGNDDAARVQSGLIRLGVEIGNLDGRIGPKTLRGLAQLGLAEAPLPELVGAIEARLCAAFPAEYEGD